MGLRVAGKLAGQRLAGSANHAATRPVTVAGVGGPSTGRVSTVQARRATANVARGLGGFVRPFKRLGGILFLEVTGVFFLLFVLVFGQMTWHARLSYAHGADHNRFLVSAGLTLVFLYLTVSSFWRARRK